MNALKRKRTQLRREFTTLENKFILAWTTSDVDIDACFIALKDVADALISVEAEITDAYCMSEDFCEADFTQDQDKALEYKQRWSEARSRYDKLHKAAATVPLTKHNSQASLLSTLSEFDTVHSKCVHKKNVKMPKLELSKFDGSVKNWIQFWGQFRKIHDDTDMDNVDKFQYLVQSTTENSAARQLVTSYPPSAANYPKAVEALKARFARDDVLIETYVRGLLSLVWSQLKGEKCSLSQLYDSLQTHLQALETLKVTEDKFASILYPMIESALPVDLLRSWNRIRSTREHSSEEKLNELSTLMSFLKAEVESEERINMAQQGFSQLTTPSSYSSPGSPTACFVLESKKGTSSKSDSISQCLWCDKETHSSVECYKATKMSPKARLEFVKSKKACQICLKGTHIAKKCRSFPKCLFCKKRHVTLLCQNLSENNITSETKERSNDLLCQLKSTTLLQTLCVKLICDGSKEICVRALIDTGAQRSYIKKDLAIQLGLKPTRMEMLTHCLFGGIETRTEEHPVYDIRVKSVHNNFSMRLSVLGQENICGLLPKVNSDVLLEQLRQKGIILTDSTATPDDVTVLIGADFLGTLMTNTFLQLDNNLTAVLTKLGWTIQGRVTGVSAATTILHSMPKLELSDLWNLEILGIRDPSEQVSKQSQETKVLQYFNETISINTENRYEVRLPWREYLSKPQPNYEIAKCRLLSTTKRLESLGKTDIYDAAFNEWLDLSIIERDPCQNNNTGHFMPHHAVIKESSATTKIRPVFDASATDFNGISLNSCLEKGSNLIELIPNLLIDFRKEAIGITADIAKAFLQISIFPEDRDYLKFLWWSDFKDPDKKVTIYRHKRVVFGVTSSPFHLAATIAYHLDRAPDHLKETAIKLKNAFYVDNCITSVNSVEEMEKFMREAKEVMQIGMFDLRCWVTAPIRSDDTSTTSVLGIIWDLFGDELSCNVSLISDSKGRITKRSLLSIVHKVFDPIGICCPTTIIPKMILQKSWAIKLSWDDELPSDLLDEFKSWADELHLLGDIKIPRRLTQNDISKCQNSLHVFCDASQAAYATCIFLRSEFEGNVCIRLVMAKARVTPSKKITIPRLELIAATLANRLATTVVQSINLKNCPIHYWTDSSVVLCWIKGDGNWSVFVSNRVREIIATSSKEAWRHISGDMNPADLPSRGVRIRNLLESRWWEGPSWLLANEENWPATDFTVDSNQVHEECKKTPINAMLTEESSFLDKLTYFSSYSKIVRMIGWALRMKYRPIAGLPHVELSCEEIERSEKALFRLIQAKYRLKWSNLQTFVDEDSIIRLETRLAYTSESYDFKSPIVLPASDTIVQRLVTERHKILQHAGTQTLMVDLREGLWIVGIRRLVKRVVNECIICKRFKSKSIQTPPASLPKNRTEATVPFQVSGVDLTGPLLLKSQSKCWIVLFTCATYRAIHLELVESLSSNDFIFALRRFIARRGRVEYLYSDNGTNFVGVNNLLNALDWNKIVSFSSVRKIKWFFLPPSAPWWGGFYERLIGVVKQMLVRVLGRASVTLSELQTVLADCESTINNRPLSYVNVTDAEELKPLTPAMFIQPLAGNAVDDLDQIDDTTLNMRVRHLQNLRDNFRQRFRGEYVSNLIQRACKRNIKPLCVGDVVLIESDSKRLLWPLGVIEETYVGRDGQERVAKVRTATGYKVRPFQRLYPLELHHVPDVILSVPSYDTATSTRTQTQTHDIPTTTVTRSGRVSRPPNRMTMA